MVNPYVVADQDALENDEDDDVLGVEYEVMCEDLSFQVCEVCKGRFKADVSSQVIATFLLYSATLTACI